MHDADPTPTGSSESGKQGSGAGAGRSAGAGGPAAADNPTGADNPAATDNPTGTESPAGTPTGAAESAAVDGGGGAPRQGVRHRWHWPRWLPPPKVTLLLFIAAAFGFLLYRIRGDLDTAIHRIRIDGLVWLPAAFGAEALSFLAYASVQQRLLLAGGARLPYVTVVRLAVAATGITNLVPGGTAPSSGWLVNQYRRHGVPLPLALWVVIVGGFAAAISVLFLCLVGAGIAGLLTLAPFVGLLAVLAGGAVAGVAVSHHVETVRRWLEGARSFPGRSALRRLLRHARDVAMFRVSARGGAEVYALNIVNWVLDAAVLATGFAVVALPVPWRALLFAYAAAEIAGALAPVPGGIGFVEGGMIGSLALAGTPAGDAVIATMIYRLVTTLGMAGIGGVALYRVHRTPPTRAKLSGDAASHAGRTHPDPPPPEP